MITFQNQTQVFEMLKSFVDLSETLNLTVTEKRLGTTRQTLRRHLDVLEAARGEKLLELVDRQYQLTDEGKLALPEAKTILARGKSWFGGDINHQNGMEQFVLEDGDEICFFQQHRLDRLWEDGPIEIQQGFKAWVDAKHAVDSSQFDTIKKYMMVFRPIDYTLQCVEVGESTIFAKWIGWKWAKSAAGRSLENSPLARVFAGSVSPAYAEVFNSGGARLDHFFGIVRKDEDEQLYAIKYQRLMFGCKYPDGSPALVIMPITTNEVSINGLPSKKMDEMSKSAVVFNS